MMRYTDAYAALQRQFHEARPDYGISGHKHADAILHFASQLQTRDILDYACGKATLQKGIPFPIQNYDPFVPEYAAEPHPAAIVVCTDVMEHVEEGCIDAVLAHLASLTRQMLYMNVATRPAAKVLPDGRNAHITQEPYGWWLHKLLYYFDLHSFQAGRGEFTVLLIPKGQAESEGGETD